jgi:predicted phosphodiesterase
MRIGLISDTHSPAMGVHPPEQVARAFEGVDLILHAGDIYSSDCLDWLELIAPVIAVEVAPAPVIGS